jgi:hypothetical protein
MITLLKLIFGIVLWIVVARVFMWVGSKLWKD